MIVDCFPFFNELDVLEIRLHELAGVVDRFVLTEATLTHSGQPKPLYFAQHKARFAGFPIDHVVVDTYDGIDLAQSWELEHHQRQVGVDYALDTYRLGASDVVVMSDCDEIPAATAVKAFGNLDCPLAKLGMQMFYYYLNLRRLDKIWYFGRIFRPVERPVDTNAFRRGHRRAHPLADAGWHFSYLGGPDVVKEKLDGFAHREESIQSYNTPENIAQQIANRADMFHRRKYRFEVVPNIDFLPRYVQEHLGRFAAHLYRASDG